MEDKKINLEQPSEELEIVELDERLDMALDPLSVIISPRPPTNGNCGNTQCCGRVLF
jgi:hypothetical protein